MDSEKQGSPQTCVERRQSMIAFLGTTAAIALVFLIFWILDKLRGERGTIGILKNLSIFRGHIWPNNTPRR